jgi:DNA-binding MarR family transcriptional regulator
MRTKKILRPSVVSWIYIMRVYALMTRRAEKILNEHGLTLVQFDVITQLGAMDECCTQGALCERLMVTKGNVSGVIDRMAREDWLTRVEDAADRRCNRIHLTAKGKKIFEKIVPSHEGWIDEMFSLITRQEQSELRDILRKLLKGLKDLEGYSEGCLD